MKAVWDPDAEKLHGITLWQLRRDGRPPLEIAAQMNRSARSSRAFADSPVDDERWLKLLFREAAIEPSFTISAVNADLLTAQAATKLGWDAAAYEEAKARVSEASPVRHRAEADARYLAELWRVVSDRQSSNHKNDGLLRGDCTFRTVHGAPHYGRQTSIPFKQFSVGPLLVRCNGS